MHAEKLANFGITKTVHGDVEATFRFFFFQGLLSIHNKDLLQCFITFYIFLKYQCIVG